MTKPRARAKPASETAPLAQIVADPKTGRPAFAVVPYDTWRAILAAGRHREDARALAIARAGAIASPSAGASARARASARAIAPAGIVRRLHSGEPPLRVWREFRALSQAELAARSGVRQAMVSRIERGQRTGTAGDLARLAVALHVEVEDLLPWSA